MIVNKSYRVGQPFVAKYDNPPIPDERQYQVGQIVEIYDDNNARMAKFQVTHSDENEVSGRIIVTYRNKRRKNDR